MVERNVFHVSPSHDGRWLARMNDEGEAHHFLSREAALADARASALRAGAGEVFIHRPDGSVEERLRVADQGPGTHPESIPSRAAVRGHPIHPMIIPFPIAFLAAAPVADIVFAFTGAAFWAQAAWVLIVAGLVTGALAAAVGLVDFAGVKAVRKHRVAWWHLASNASALLLTLVNFFVRLGDPVDGVLPVGLLLSLVTAGLLVAGGWFGGELSYRHRIGVSRWRDDSATPNVSERMTPRGAQ